MEVNTNLKAGGIARSRRLAELVSSEPKGKEVKTMAGDLARALALYQQADLDRLPGPQVLDRRQWHCRHRSAGEVPPSAQRPR